MQRVLTAAVGIPLALAALFYLPRAGFLALVAALLLTASVELCRIARAIGAAAAVWALPAVILWAAVLCSEPGSPLATGWSAETRMLALVSFATLGAASLALVGRGSLAARGLGAALLGLGSLYLALPLVSFDRLRASDPYLVLLVLGVVWATDSGAYLVGRTWGRSRLAPAVSPNKTWEGAIGGLVLGVVVAALWSWWRLGGIESGVLAVGGAVSVAGQLGDLIESLLKRIAGVKDSGALLPGHGGMFDRLDSLIVAVPVLDLLWPFVGPA